MCIYTDDDLNFNRIFFIKLLEFLQTDKVKYFFYNQFCTTIQLVLLNPLSVNKFRNKYLYFDVYLDAN